MEKSTFTEAAKFLRERRVKRRRQAVVFGLAFVIVGATAWGLLQKGHAMTRPEGVLDCQYEIHTHSEDCYADGGLVCGKVEYVVHAHDEACYDEDGGLACQLPEEAGHVHNESCFETEKVLICDLAESEPVSYEESYEEEDTAAYAEEEDSEPEILYVSETGEMELICGLEAHSHSGSCYSDGEEILVCDRSESESHSHSDSCYKEEKSLKCDNEDEDHEHDDGCYETSEERICGQSESEGHSHNSDCYEITGGELVCDQEEHEHTDACYAEVSEGVTKLPSEGEDSDNGQGTSGSDNSSAGHEHDDSCYRTVRKYASCGEEGVHTHDDSCYLDGSLICEVPVVESLEEHVHDEECFKAEEDVEYTKTFEDDDIRVTVSYKSSAEIAKDAELLVEEITDEEDLEEYAQRLEEKDALAGTDSLALLLRMGFYTDDEVFQPKDRVNVTVEFLNEEIYAEDDEVTAAGFTKDDVELISGTDGSISFETEEFPELGFIVVGEDPHTLTYENDDYIVTVALDEETEVPEDAELVVEETTQESGLSHYKQRLAELEEEDGLLDEEETIALLLDMRILADGREMPLEKTADVTVQFLNNDIYFEGDAVKAAYFTDGGIDLLSASDTDSENATTFEVDELAEAAFITAGDMRVMTCEGDGFIVTVRFGPKALIPEEAVLNAERITQESDPDCFTEHEDKLKDHVEVEGKERVELNMLMKIGFYVAEEEIEPQDTVDVKIQLLDREGIEKNSSDVIRMAHFAKKGIEQLEDADVAEDEGNGLTMSFQTDSFSFFVAYSLDDGNIDDAASFYKAIENAGDGDTIELDGDFEFPGDSGVGTPTLKAKNVTLDLKGHVITLNSNAITLVKIGDDKNNGGLLLKDSEAKAPSKSVGSASPAYDKNQHKLTCTVTESTPDSPATGRTTETSYIYTVSGGAIVGNEGNKEPALRVSNSGSSLDIESGIIFGNGNRAVRADFGGVKLKGGYLINNVAKDYEQGDGKDGDGGAVKCDNGRLDISGTVVLSGNKGWEGGAIHTYNSPVTVAGGYITNNESMKSTGWDGGGLKTMGSSLEISGGYFTGNRARGNGGGIVTDGTAFVLNGGHISGNISKSDVWSFGNEGGGIALMGSTVAVIGNGSGKVYITNNEVTTNIHWGGGGLFVSDTATAYLYNTLVTNNHAGGFGGGVAGCSTGRIVDINPLQGAAVFDNTADGKVESGDGSAKREDTIYTDPETNPVFWQGGRYQDYFSALYSYVDNRMLGKGSQNWDGTVDGKNIDPAAGTWTSSYVIGLTANPSAGDKANAKGLARVYVTGNKSATHGGGILCNGILIIGDDHGEMEIASALTLKAVKNLTDNSGKAVPLGDRQFSFKVYDDEACTNVVSAGQNGTKDKDGKIVDIESIIFDRLLTFDLKHDFPGSTSHDYIYYIKEDAESGYSGIVADGTVYRMTVTVEKKDHGAVGNVKKYIDDITKITIAEKVTDKNGEVSWTVVQTEQPASNEIHAVDFVLTPANKAAAFVNTEETTTKIVVEKQWSNDVKLTAKDSVTVALYQNDVLYTGVGQLTLNDANHWKGEWSNLPAKDSKGVAYNYTVKETAVTKGQLGDYDIDYKYETADGVTAVTVTNTLKEFSIELFKNDENRQPLLGAGFAVLSVGNTPLSFIDKGNEYVFCEEPADTSEKTTTTLLTKADGTLKVTGLRAGTYTIKEVEVPFGCTAVDDHKITLSGDAKNSVTIPAKKNEKPDATFSSDMHTLTLTLIDKVKIYRLPESGGIGTRIFYILGSIMVLGSLALLITRRRLSRGNNKSN